MDMSNDDDDDDEWSDDNDDISDGEHTLLCVQFCIWQGQHNRKQIESTNEIKASSGVKNMDWR